MNINLISYIDQILKLRGQFSAISHINKGSEAMKIWARWIITHRSLCHQHNLILPDDEEYDIQFIKELQEKGVDKEHAVYLHDWLIMECRTINKSYSLIATSEWGGIHGDQPVSVQLGNGFITMTAGQPGQPGQPPRSQIIPTSVYNRMSRAYTGIPRHKNSYIWFCTTVYSLLDGKGLQWAVPPAVMSLLQSHLGCYTELFASPLNNYNKQYYSLFPLDNIFGSKGNFFHAPDSHFKEGAFQINPPFIDQLFTKTGERVLDLLEKADLANRELTFIYIMPEWKDFPAYNIMIESRFMQRKIFLRSGQHYYYQYSNGSYIPARFGTHMFFLSTNPKICSSALESNIRYSFQQR
jgi:hypothetical protein